MRTSRGFTITAILTLALVLVVLLIPCTNVALLILARNAKRQREMAVRMALGAGRIRLLRQLLAESILLVVAGAGLGWMLTSLTIPVLARQLVLAGYDLSFRMDPRVFWFTFGIAALAGIVFGLAPLFSALRIPPTLAMKSGSASAGTGRNRLLGRRLAVSAQAALCVVLLVAAGLMVRTLRRYQTQDLGIRTHGLVTFGLNPVGLHSNGQIIHFYQNLLDKLRVLPGVESAAIEETAPGMDNSDNNGLISMA